MTVVTEVKPRIRVPARSALLASTAMPTIQFRGIGAAGKKPAADDDEDMEHKDDEIVGDENPDDGKGTKKGKKTATKRARANDDENPEDEDPEDDDPDGDGDDDDNDEESDRREARGDTPVRAARLRERARIAAILESPAAAANLEFAVRLALTTDLPRKEAIGLLKAAPKATGGKLAERMATYGAQRPGAGAPAAPKGQAAIDALWDAQAVANGIARRRA